MKDDLFQKKRQVEQHKPILVIEGGGEALFLCLADATLEDDE